MPVVVRRPAPPLDGLITSITYRACEQPRTSVEKILPGAETGLWVNLNRDAFRSFSDAGQVHQVPGAMAAGPTEYLRSRVDGPNHLLFPSRACPE